MFKHADLGIVLGKALQKPKISVSTIELGTQLAQLQGWRVYRMLTLFLGFL
jgi:hypothetical protein